MAGFRKGDHSLTLGYFKVLVTIILSLWSQRAYKPKNSGRGGAIPPDNPSSEVVHYHTIKSPAQSFSVLNLIP